MKTKFSKDTKREGIWNPTFREFVTEASFHLTLSKNQIRFLVEAAERSKWTDDKGIVKTNMFIVAYRALHAKGLMSSIGTLTKAGELTVGLLKEAGLYQEMLTVYAKEPNVA